MKNRLSPSSEILTSFTASSKQMQLPFSPELHQHWADLRGCMSSSQSSQSISQSTSLCCVQVKLCFSGDRKLRAGDKFCFTLIFSVALLTQQSRQSGIATYAITADPATHSGAHRDIVLEGYLVLQPEASAPRVQEKDKHHQNLRLFSVKELCKRVVPFVLSPSRIFDSFDKFRLGGDAVCDTDYASRWFSPSQ